MRACHDDMHPFSEIASRLQGALGLLAMRAAVGDALPLRALQMTFVSAVDVGPASAHAEVLRRGRAMTHAQCRLMSGERVAALLTTGALPKCCEKRSVSMVAEVTITFRSRRLTSSCLR